MESIPKLLFDVKAAIVRRNKKPDRTFIQSGSEETTDAADSTLNGNGCS
jgi:hypothetical protein